MFGERSWHFSSHLRAKPVGSASQTRKSVMAMSLVAKTHRHDPRSDIDKRTTQEYDHVPCGVEEDGPHNAQQRRFDCGTLSRTFSASLTPGRSFGCGWTSSPPRFVIGFRHLCAFMPSRLMGRLSAPRSGPTPLSSSTWSSKRALCNLRRAKMVNCHTSCQGAIQLERSSTQPYVCLGSPRSDRLPTHQKTRLRAYFFQFSWIVPGIFNPQTNRRQHYYFGASFRNESARRFEFWTQARERRVDRAYFSFGSLADCTLRARL